MNSIAVIGAGPAGLHLASLLSPTFDVTVYEKKTEQQLLDSETWSDSIDLDVLPLLDIPIPQKQNGIFSGLYVKNAARTEGIFEPVKMSSSPRITADRVRLSIYMIHRARAAGVTIKFQEPVKDLVYSVDPEVAVTGLISENNGTISQHDYDLTVDASGFAAIRTQLPGPIGQPLPEHDCLSAYKTLRQLTPEADLTRIINGSSIPGKKGYQWVSLVDRDIVDAGCCVVSDTVSEKGAREYTNAMLDTLGIRDTPVVSEGGSVIPMTLPVPLLTVTGFAVLGESAGMTDPGNGCGISNGLRAAELLASILMRVPDFSASSLWSYSQQWLSSQGSENVLRYLPDLNCSEEDIQILKDYGIFSGSLINDICLENGEPLEISYPELYRKMLAVRQASDRLSRHLRQFPSEYLSASFDHWYQEYLNLNRQLRFSAVSDTE